MNIRLNGKGILTIFFLVSLYLPFVASLLNLEQGPSLTENRILASFPGLDFDMSLIERRPGEIETWLKFVDGVIAYPQKFNAFFNDHFGFRNSLVRGYGILMLHGLPSPQVIVGKNGWLFLSQNGIESYRSTRLFTHDELLRWQHLLEERRKRLAQNNIIYLFVIAPEKSTVYPEFLPDNVRRVSNDSRLDQLMTQLHNYSDVYVLDLRNVLRASKSRGQLYMLTDTHWNDYGAFIAYEEIMRQLQELYPGIDTISESSFREQIEREAGGDLARMLAVSGIVPEDRIKLIPVVPPMAHKANAGFTVPNILDGKQPLAMETGNASLPRAVMFRDSFGEALVPFLSEHFSRIVSVFGYDLDYDAIEREHPQIVIQEIVERALLESIPVQ